MDPPASKPVHMGKTVQIDSHALDTLRYIRASMDGAASINVPGSAAICVGIVGVLTTTLSLVPNLAAHWLAIWLIGAVFAAGIGCTLMVKQFALVGAGPIYARAPVRKLLLCWTPSLFAGAAMTAVHWASGNVNAVPGTWLLLYGCALIGASAVTMRAIGVLGVAFFACGLLALVLPARAQMLLLGAGFGGLHLVFGFWIRRATHGSETQS